MLKYDVVPPVAGEAKAWCIVLHGLGDSMEGWRPIVGELAVPELGFVLVNAPDPYYGGWAWFPILGMTGEGVTQDDMDAGVRRSRGLVAELVGHLEQELGVSADRFVLMGFSQGCCMVLDAALRDQRRFAGVVGISGFVSDLDDLSENMSQMATEQQILWTHGRFDSVVPLPWSQACFEAVQALGVEADYRLYDKDHGLDPVNEISELRAWIAERID
ncbi:MAG: hypothetical protein PF961_22890 [Planctomycetota bacterium]|nr:hypothetical protein [Planctomycetota bacterium]